MPRKPSNHEAPVSGASSASRRCPYCHKQHCGAYSYCDTCRPKVAARASAARSELRAAGLCRDGCGRAGNHRCGYCKRCYEKSLARNRVK